MNAPADQLPTVPLITLTPFPRAVHLTVDNGTIREDDGAGTIVTHPIDPIGPWPFADHAVDTVHLADLLDHLPARKAPLVVLEAARVLRPAGEVRITVTDIDTLCRMWVAGPPAQSVPSGELYYKTLLTRQLYGAQTDPHAYRQSGWDRIMVADLLRACGFPIVTEEDVPSDPDRIAFTLRGGKR